MRYLSEENKANILKRFHDSLADLPLHDERGGYGFPDPDMIPWCEKINSIHGVCTLQSCAGHKGDYEIPGHLWIWLREDLAELFHRRAPVLAQYQLIERLSTVYTSGGREVAVITFAGNNRDLLSESMRVILSFFENLQAEYPLASL